MNVEWHMVKAKAAQGVQSAQKALETCEVEKLEFHRGQLAAYRDILRMGAEPGQVSMSGIPTEL